MAVATMAWYDDEQGRRARGGVEARSCVERRDRPARLRYAASLLVLSCLISPSLSSVGCVSSLPLGSHSLAALRQKIPSLRGKEKDVLITQLRDEVSSLEKQLTSLERTVALLQGKAAQKEDHKQTVHNTVSQTTKLAKKSLEDSPIATKDQHVGIECAPILSETTPAWIDALGLPSEASANKVFVELDPSVIDSDVDEGPSPVPSPPNEQQGVDFTTNILDVDDQVDLSSVTPREMTPSVDLGTLDAKTKFDQQALDQQAPIEVEAVSRVNTMGRTDLPIRIQRTQSMFDIVVPESVAASKPQKPIEELVFFLDIDKCAIYGQDGNDLAIAMQWMGRAPDALRGLYRCLLNPQLKPLFNQLTMSVEKIPVVLYTMRPQLLRYRSQVRAHRINLEWNPKWHHTKDQVNWQIAIPAEIRDASEILAEYVGQALYPQEQQDLTMSFQRLLAIRDVVKAELGLEETPVIVVSATVKDVQATANRLGLCAARSYLWDDNEVLFGQPHVLTVEPYVALPPTQKKQILAFLEEQLPAEQLSDEVVEFMLGAQPELRSMAVESSGRRRYALNECQNLPRFPIPDLPLHYPTPRFTVPAMDGYRTRHDAPRPDGGAGQYCGSLAEYYSLAWRKPDASALEASDRMTWKESMEMVW